MLQHEKPASAVVRAFPHLFANATSAIRTELQSAYSFDHSTHQVIKGTNQIVEHTSRLLCASWSGFISRLWALHGSDEPVCLLTAVIVSQSHHHLIDEDKSRTSRS